mmetsp:Transcript_113783/g.223195  ORF Transcript_113783/g.223195 Transcript_113783/m.223195 type:complete len:216 (-) Transcript_113783:106-753(-)
MLGYSMLDPTVEQAAASLSKAAGGDMAKPQGPCATPQSQVSTAPPTPAMRFTLDDGDEVVRSDDSFVAGGLERTWSDLTRSGSEMAEDWPPMLPEAEDEVPRLCISMPLLQSELGKWAQWAVRWEEAHGTPFEEDEDLDDGDDESSIEDEPEPVPEQEVQWPPVLPEAPSEVPRLCAGLPPLESDLARWARWAVAYEEAEADRVFFPEEDGESDE